MRTHVMLALAGLVVGGATSTAGADEGGSAAADPSARGAPLSFESAVATYRAADEQLLPWLELFHPDGRFRSEAELNAMRVRKPASHDHGGGHGGAHGRKVILVPAPASATTPR